MKRFTKHFCRVLASVIFLSFLTGCTNGRVAQSPKPSVLLNASLENTKIISQTMTDALNGKKIILNENAFIKTYQHTLEKKSFTGSGASSVDGLILGFPIVHRFSMFSKSDNSCYLVYEKTGTHYPLNNLKCRAL